MQYDRTGGFVGADLQACRCIPHLMLVFAPPLPLQLYEVQFDRTGGFTGVKLGMSLKGHKSKVFCLDFSPDLTKVGAWPFLVGCWQLSLCAAAVEL